MTKIAESIEEIWKEILETEIIKGSDNFFELGGNSIQVLKVMHAINERCNTDVDLETFVDNPTINDLVKIVEETSLNHRTS